MFAPRVYFWRAIYGVLDLPWLRRMLANRYRALERNRGSGAARKFLRRTLFSLSLNRLRTYEGHVPLEAWLAFWEISRSVDSSGQVPRRAARAREKLRIGHIGTIADFPFFPRKLFCDMPAGIELHHFETAREMTPEHHLHHTEATSVHNVTLRWDNNLPSDGIASQPDYLHRVEDLAARINNAQLDLLLVSEAGRELYDMLDRIDVPCIADMTVSCNACFHPNIDIQFYIHAMKEYVVQDDRLFCRDSMRPLRRPPFVVPYCLLFDTTGYDGPPVPWAKRNHTLLFHGRLVKAAQPPFLKMVLDLLEEDSNLTWLLYGTESHDALNTIRTQAKRRGVEGRVDFRGKFTLERNPGGEIIDPAWHRFLSDMRHAKLEPTPFPMASGSARFESYTAGLPCVNLAIRPGPRHSRSAGETLIDIPAFYTPSATVTDHAAYFRTALHLLHEPELAAKVIAEQREVVQRLGSPRCFWQQILDAHARWLAQRTHSSPT